MTSSSGRIAPAPVLSSGHAQLSADNTPPSQPRIVDSRPAETRAIRGKGIPATSPWLAGKTFQENQTAAASSEVPSVVPVPDSPAETGNGVGPQPAALLSELLLPVNAEAPGTDAKPEALSAGAATPGETRIVQPAVEDCSYSYFGVSAKLSNTWLLNEQTFAGLSSRGLDQTHLFVTPVFGFHIGHYFTRRFAAEGRIYINSKYGQRYSIFDDGVVRSEKYVFNGHTLSAGVKYGVKMNGNNGLFVDGGAQLLLLNSLVETGDVSPPNGYTHLYPFLFAGASYVIEYGKAWQFSGGIRSSVGLSDVYQIRSNPAFSFEKTFLSDLSLHVSVSRTFGKNSSHTNGN
jgi:hypothetical protein